MEKWLIGCSGGPDSMYLLNWAKDQYECVVVHINYHKRDSAMRDQNIVINYCLKHNIKYYVFDYDLDIAGNFQANARIFRYQKFRLICNLHKCLGVMVAHHQDDLVESILIHYLSYHPFKFFGLKEYNYLDGLLVYRPLLNVSKENILDYCHLNNLDYGRDESNDLPIYLRNKLRLQLNSQLKKLILVYGMSHNYVISLNSRIKYHNYQSLNFYQLYYYVYSIIKKHISWKQYQDIYQFIKSNQKKYQFRNGNVLYKNDNFLKLMVKMKEWEIKFESLNCLINSSVIDNNPSNNRQILSLSDCDFPLTFRSVKNGDKILFDFGHKKINRFFIDNKISLNDRYKYWVIVNAKDEVIFVNGIGADINHQNHKFNLNIAIKNRCDLL